MSVTRYYILAVLAALVLALTSASPAPVQADSSDSSNGPATIEIYGGKRGKIDFPHRAHQERLGDCQRCHSLFPKQHDALKNLKKAGKLSSKKVMNKLCIKCHKAEKRAGRPSGPTTCSKCHTRK